MPIACYTGPFLRRSGDRTGTEDFNAAVQRLKQVSGVEDACTGNAGKILIYSGIGHLFDQAQPAARQPHAGSAAKAAFFQRL